MPQERRRTWKTPKLVRLERDSVYCECCKETIVAGDPVAWWRIASQGGRKRWAAYCDSCHWASIRAGHPIR